MFGWLKSKKAPSDDQIIDTFTRIPNADFVEMAGRLVDDSPNACAMIVIAFENLKPLMSAMFHIAKEKPGQGSPKNIDEVVNFFGTRVDRQPNEIAERRCTWFFFAAIIARATSLAETDRQFEAAVARMWIKLAEGASYLHTILPSNTLWSEDEKTWFSHIRSESYGISYVLVQMLPRRLRKNPDIRRFADEHDLGFLILRD